MAKYINLEEMMKFPIRRNHYGKEHGNEDFICGIDCLPCGYLRLFSHSTLTAGPALSNFEIYAK